MIPITTLLLGIWIALLAALERIFPAARQPAGHGRLARNLALGALVLAASPLVQWATQWAVSDFRPLFAIDNIFLHLLILDIWTYALHRAYHRVPFMWRMHSVHHFDATLDVSSAVRFHIFEILFSSILRLIPLIAFGIPLETNLLFGTILTASAMFHHSNLRLPPAVERALSWVIVTPSIHWVHHHAVQRDTDSNYASLLSLWDRLFGSASITVRWRNMPIGVEGGSERTLPRLLLHPLFPKMREGPHA